MVFPPTNLIRSTASLPPHCVEDLVSASTTWSSVWSSPLQEPRRSAVNGSTPNAKHRRKTSVQRPFARARVDDEVVRTTRPSGASSTRRGLLSASTRQTCRHPMRPSSWMAGKTRALREGLTFLRTNNHSAFRTVSSCQGLSGTSCRRRRSTATPPTTTPCPSPPVSTTPERTRSRVARSITPLVCGRPDDATRCLPPRALWASPIS